MEVLALLTLPTTSSGLGFLRSTATESATGSASPRRKVARLDTDSDITSSSSRSKSRIAQTKGPIIIRVQTDDNAARKTDAEIRRERDTQMNDLRRCMTEILDETVTTTNPLNYKTCEKAYSICRSLVVVHDAGSELYTGFQQRVGETLGRITSKLLSANKNMDAEDWIGLVVQYCKWFSSRIVLLQSLLTYLDQVYVVQHSTTRASLHDQAHHMFVQGILDNPAISELLFKAVKTWLDWEREHRTAAEKRSVIPELVEQLSIHGQYGALETYYIETTQDYYRQESKANAQQNDAIGFFREVQARIQEEVERAKAVLPVGSWAAVQKEVESSLLAKRVEWLSQSILPTLMDANNTQVIAEMYNLFSRVDGLKPLQKAFRDYVQKGVETIVKDAAKDDEMVPRLLALKTQASNTISKAFTTAPRPSASQNQGSTSTPPAKQPDTNFVTAMNDAFTYGFRARRNKPAEMIARYLHLQLRKGQKNMSDEEFKAALDEVLALYRFSEDKDVFRTFYHRSLARRLLSGSSASDDFEAAMLKELKEKYDPEFGMGEDMFKDLHLSKDLMRAYHETLQPGDSALKLNVTVLQRSAWPFSAPKNVVDLPPKMREDLDRFTRYYKSKHSGRVLEWDHALGTAVLKSRFKAGVKDLSLNLHQALVLLQFNGEDELPFKDLKERLRMDDAELRRTLQSLACGKKKVLKKLPPGKDVEDDDVFRFNADFWDERARVHISSIQEKITAEESQRTNEAIEGDRKHYLDAAIVRIMKGKKEMSYEQLKAATIDAVKSHFVPSVDSIKKRIDALVESDYLERNPEVSQYIKIVAVSTSKPETAIASARKYSELTGSEVKPYYGDADKIASDPDIDFIAVSVKAPCHKEVVEKAIAHGKGFFVEWPAGKSLEETRELGRLAKQRGVKSVVGLQGRQSKATLKVKRIIDSGKIGKVTAVTVNFLIPRELRAWVPISTSNHAYTVDRSNGVTLLGTTSAHALDHVFQALGPLSRLSASATTLHPTVTVVDDKTGEPIGRTLQSQFPDHITITGVLKDSGAWTTIIIRQGHPSNPGQTQLLWDIDGEEGALKVEDTQPLGWIISAREPESIYLNGEKLAWNAEEDGERAESVVPFLKNTWMEFLKGKEGGGRFASIDDAVKLKEVLFAIETSLENGSRWIDLE